MNALRDVVLAALLAALLATSPAAGADGEALSLDAAIVTAIAHNRELRVQRFAPQRSAVEVERARARFDATVSAAVAAGSADERLGEPFGDVAAAGTTWSAEVGVEQTLATGTTIAATAATGREVDADTGPIVVSRGNLTVTQALLRGARPEVNLAAVRQARLEVEASQYELRGFIEALVANVEGAFWRYALARSRAEIVASSLALSQRQLDEAREAVEIGKLAGIQLAASEAELALRREEAIAARGAADEARLRLLDLMGAPANGRPAPIAAEVPAAEADDADDRVALARRLRPELNQARLRLRRGDLEIVRTRNGLLPRLDLFVALGGTGYAASFRGSLDGDDGKRSDVSVGLRFSQALGRREAQASHTGAVIDRQQGEAALENLSRLVELEVRLAQSAAAHAFELIGARIASETAQQAKLDAEVEKLRTGTSTTLTVAQAERDLLASRLAAAESVVAFRIALAELHRSDGSLLARRGIDAPGAQPQP